MLEQKDGEGVTLNCLILGVKEQPNALKELFFFPFFLSLAVFPWDFGTCTNRAVPEEKEGSEASPPPHSTPNNHLFRSPTLD